MDKSYPIACDPASKKNQKKPVQLHLSAALRTFQDRLPQRPYCTNDLGQGLLIRSANQAIGFRYIQPNPPVMKGCLVYDIDRPGGIFAAEDAGLPAPSLAVENPTNRHVHLYYYVGIPICTSPSGRPGPIRYAGAIDVAFADALRADRGYSGLISKNPMHSAWATYPGPPLYDLEELAEYVDLEKYKDRRKHLPAYGLGRNCTLFDRLRHWAYKQVDQYRAAGDFETWIKAVVIKAASYNDFAVRLPEPEVKATAKSVGKWTWQNYFGRLPDAQFAAVQRKRIARRWGQPRASAAKQYRLFDKPATIAQVAQFVERSPRQVRRYLSKDRAEFEAETQARRDRARELRAQGLRWKEVGQQMGGISAEAARSLGQRARKKAVK